MTSYSQEAYIEALSSMHYLRGLSIAPFFPFNQRLGFFGNDAEETKCAVFLAGHLPNLEYVAFQSIASLDSPPDYWVGVPRLMPPGPGNWNNWTRYDLIREGVGGRLVARWNDACT